MQKLLFIDRDGTLIEEPSTDFQIDSLSKFKLLPCVVSALTNIVQQGDYKLVMVTNQDGLGTPSFPDRNFWPLQNLLLDILQSEGVTFESVHIDRSFSYENSPFRKPNAGMLTNYFNGKYNLAESYVIGDRLTDLELARNIGTKSIWFASPLKNCEPFSPDFISSSWVDIARFLTQNERKAFVCRKTRETDIRVALNLDKSQAPNIETGIGFFNHMLEQIGFHGGFMLDVQCVGDLRVDEHHTIEDVALVLGNAFNQAIGNKNGLSRYGFYVPMDEALAQVVVDFSGRPFLKWDVPLTGCTVGGIDASLFEHFFYSFCQKAQCTLHISASGTNNHHVIESVFKAFARALRMALSRTSIGGVPSSKGII